jgi:hypothetical protein
MNYFYEAPTPEDIYRQLTEGPGVSSLSSTQENARNEQLLEDHRAGVILALGDLVKTGWQGNASDGAYGATVPLAVVAGMSSEKLGVAEDLIGRQMDSFSYAANSVRPVSALPPNPLDDMIPFETDYDRQVKAYQGDAQHNIAIYSGYDNASQYNETNLPQEFSPHSGGPADVSMAPPRDTIEVREPEPGGPSADGPDNYSGPGGGPAPGSTDHPRSTENATDPAGGQTSPNEWRPPVSDPAGSRTQQPAAGQQSPISAGPGFVGPGYLGGGPDGVTGGGRRGAGSSSGYGGRGSGGYGGGAAGGGAAGGPGAGGRAVGPGLGVGAGALAAEEAAARRAGQVAGGRPPLTPFGAPIAGSRGKDDDEEHTRKILVEADGEEVFGIDTLTAPQVIGDEEYED